MNNVQKTNKFVYEVNNLAYSQGFKTTERQYVKISEFKRWLESQGVLIKDGANHWKLYHNGKQSTLPRHPSKELAQGTHQAILKQLGMK